MRGSHGGRKKNGAAASPHNAKKIVYLQHHLPSYLQRVPLDTHHPDTIPRFPTHH